MELDNQQERLVRLGWAGGIVDGEGCVTYYIQHHKRSKVWRPLVTVVNTNPVLINRFCEILDSETVSYWRGVHKKNSYLPHHKIVEVVRIQGTLRVKRFLDVLAPFIIAKQPQCQVLLEMITYRLERPKDSPYAEKEQAWLAELKRLNHLGLKSSETLCHS